MPLEQLTQMLTTKNAILLLFVGLTIALFVFLSPRRESSPEKQYFKAKKMKREEMEKYITSLEKKILDLDKTINEMKIKQHDLEIKFTTQRNESLHKQLMESRKKLTELANKRDRLLEEKQVYSKAYRDVTI